MKNHGVFDFFAVNKHLQARLNYAVKVTEYSVNFSRLKNAVKCNEITEIIKSLKIH